MINNFDIGLDNSSTNTLLSNQNIKIYHKIIGYNPKIEQSNQNLIPLRTILPISINQLDFLLTNLIQIILEVIKRDLETPDISLNKIMVIENSYDCGIPFIFSKEDNTTAKQCEDKLCKQFSLLCEQLGYEQEFFNSSNLKQFQDRLLLKINFQEDSLLENTKTLLQYLKIEQPELIFSNKNTYLYAINPPSIILKELNHQDKIAIKISQIIDKKFYELREIEIIEEFNHKHLPYLYGYLRYSDIIILFLKKHDHTFNWVSSELFKKRKELRLECIAQILYKSYGSMVDAISVIHTLDLIHRDLKPENIMFDLSQFTKNAAELAEISFNCVFIDFDRSIVIDNMQTQLQSNYKGTPFFQPPEGIQKKYHQSYDIWQLGFMWLVISKQFFYKKTQQKSSEKQFFENICEIKTKIQEINKQLADYLDQISQLNVRRIDNIQKQKEKNSLEIKIKICLNEKKKLYDDQIQKIEDQENFITYNIQLQNLIKKMIELEPENRANITEIQAVFNTLID